MNAAAIGVRMHSGWGALVAVASSAGIVEVIDSISVGKLGRSGSFGGLST